MSAPKKSANKPLLTEDGELIQDFEESEESAPEAIFCTNCGTNNAPDAKFCRKCGSSLLEQEANTVGVARSAVKTKNDLTTALQKEAEDREPVPTKLHLATLIFVASMIITSLITPNNGAVAIFVMIAWFLVEAIRHDKKTFSPTVVNNSIMTMGFITVMVLTSLIVPNVSTAALFILGGWFLLEAVRS